MATSIFSKLSRQSRHRDLFDGAEGTPPPGNYKAASTLDSLAAMNLTLTARAKCCGRTAVLPKSGLAAAFGGETLMAAVRFRCRECGKDSFDIGPAGMADDAPALPEWLEPVTITPLPKPDADYRPRMPKRRPKEEAPEETGVDAEDPALFDGPAPAGRKEGDEEEGGGEEEEA